MINTKYYKILDSTGYKNKTDAYDVIRICYGHLKGVTTYYDEGKYYIVQSKVIANV